MKAMTHKSANLYSPEFGWLKQTKTFLFGFRFWTENSFIEVPENVEEKATCQIIAERQVSYSEMTANLPELSNDHFDIFQKEIFPTRF